MINYMTELSQPYIISITPSHYKIVRTAPSPWSRGGAGVGLYLIDYQEQKWNKKPLRLEKRNKKIEKKKIEKSAKALAKRMKKM